MAKTDVTIKLEKEIFNATKKQGVFGCFEVTIGWYGKERVDFMTYDTKGVWRCYEIKASKNDFRSSASHTFCGNFNYYVVTQVVYDQVKNEIPNHIGVYIGNRCEKKSKKQQLLVDEQILKDSLIRSLSRDVQKSVYASDVTKMNLLKREVERLRKQNRESQIKCSELYDAVRQKMGREWARENMPCKTSHNSEEGKLSQYESYGQNNG